MDLKFLAAMNQNHWIEDIPVIMISSEDSDSYIRRAYEMGVSDYISRPFDAKNRISTRPEHDQAICKTEETDPSGDQADLRKREKITGC